MGTSQSQSSKPKKIKFTTKEEESAYLNTLTSPERAFYHCRFEKKKFNKCYRHWWSVAIKGQGQGQGQGTSNHQGGGGSVGIVDRSDCDELLEEYQDCVLSYLAKEKEGGR